MVEIYNEQVRDLLTTYGSPKRYPFFSNFEHVILCMDFLLVLFVYLISLNAHTWDIDSISTKWLSSPRC